MQASKILCISSVFTNPTSELVCFSLIIVPTILITKSFRPKLVGLTQSHINYHTVGIESNKGDRIILQPDLVL
ncbi:hypothetical protein CDL15_Pgr006363 [Punica granatum]|uniref:Uncharacterized protein n=1 Tax=Punica granatum TaxID=22663 RepID=A0A218WAM3_PUNGR|nr:hypothetical protein CDL15_Pgr006363 [Punica granatum]